MSDKDLGQGKTAPQGVKGSQADGKPPVNQGQALSEGVTLEQIQKLQKSVDDLTRQRAEAQSRADKMAAENKRLNDEILNKLATGVDRLSAPKDDKDAQAAEWRKMVEKLDDADAETMLEVIDAYTADGMTKAQENTLKQVMTMMEEKLAPISTLASHVERLEAQIRDRDPDYVARADSINGLAEKYGLDPNKDRDVLLKIDKDLHPETPKREPLPGSAGGSGVHASAGSVDDTDKLSDEDAAITASMTRQTVEEVKRLYKKAQQAKKEGSYEYA